MTPVSAFDWLVWIVFVIATPPFFWFLYQEKKRTKRTKNFPKTEIR